MKKETKKQLLHDLFIVFQTVFYTSLIFTHLYYRNDNRRLEEINHYKNNYVETIIIEDKSAGFDSIVTRRDTTYYFKNDTLVTRSVRKTK